MWMWTYRRTDTDVDLDTRVPGTAWELVAWLSGRTSMPPCSCCCCPLSSAPLPAPCSPPDWPAHLSFLPEQCPSPSLPPQIPWHQPRLLFTAFRDGMTAAHAARRPVGLSAARPGFPWPFPGPMNYAGIAEQRQDLIKSECWTKHY